MSGPQNCQRINLYGFKAPSVVVICYSSPKKLKYSTECLSEQSLWTWPDYSCQSTNGRLPWAGLVNWSPNGDMTWHSGCGLLLQHSTEGHGDCISIFQNIPTLAFMGLNNPLFSNLVLFFPWTSCWKQMGPHYTLSSVPGAWTWPWWLIEGPQWHWLESPLSLNHSVQEVCNLSLCLLSGRV